MTLHIRAPSNQPTMISLEPAEPEYASRTIMLQQDNGPPDSEPTRFDLRRVEKISADPHHDPRAAAWFVERGGGYQDAYAKSGVTEDEIKVVKAVDGTQPYEHKFEPLSGAVTDDRARERLLFMKRDPALREFHKLDKFDLYVNIYKNHEDCMTLVGNAARAVADKVVNVCKQTGSTLRGAFAKVATVFGWGATEAMPKEQCVSAVQSTPEIAIHWYGRNHIERR
ncbi:uncharacterized protein B0H18DRAFT_992611 [Fomitopsis serialis]|uniref:uncharacterized protein n=1 Tax=Fomitopsis serialis TaxID=139415 RepID=UPI0020080BA4|nr:uncharacterized protein B0H18DRAFT_992611 [Neoantrodia serialis]KAH9930628.1 hypothetical protein B0H18DRAFT_992611 [Neoantrodia serialis]